MTALAIAKSVQDDFVTAMKYEMDVNDKSSSAAMLAAIATIFGADAQADWFWWTADAKGLYRPVSRKEVQK